MPIRRIRSGNRPTTSGAAAGRYSDSFCGFIAAMRHRSARRAAPLVARPNVAFSMIDGPACAVGIGYRSAIDTWTRAHLNQFDVLEITVDHCITGDATRRSAIFDLAG